MRRASTTLMIALAALLLWAGAPRAQQASPFGGFKVDPRAPIEVVADALEVRQSDQVAIFSGAVEATQADLRISAERLEVTYGDSGEQGPGRIRFMKATGGVVIVNRDKTARAAWAEYDVTKGIIRMGGDVVLTQGRNVIKGERLVMNLDTGVGRIEGGGKGRVKSVFTPTAGARSGGDDDN